MATNGKQTTKGKRKATSQDNGDYRVETWPVERLTAHPQNYRRHPEVQIAHLRASLREHGFRKPIVVQADGRILAGHGLEIAAREEGLTEVPVHVYDGPAPLRYMVADNETSWHAEDDLAALLELADEWQPEELAGTGLEALDLQELRREVHPYFEPVSEDEQGRLDQKTPIRCPKCGHEWHP